MSRLDKKCLLGATGAHVLLIGVLIVGPAFVSSTPKSDDTQVLTILPDLTTDKMFTTGGNPAVVTPTLAPKPDPKPEPVLPKPVPTPPVPEVRPEPKPEPKPPQPKALAKLEPNPLTRAVQVPKTPMPPSGRSLPQGGKEAAPSKADRVAPAQGAQQGVVQVGQ